MKKRMSEMKAKMQSLEYKEKWNWRALVKKRTDLECEKIELK